MPVIGVIILAALILPFLKTVQAGISLTAIDSRETSGIWIEQNLPHGSRIAIESYAPFIDPKNYSVQAFLWMIDETPEWFKANHFDYLVFSQRSFGRYYAQPVLYSNEIAQYNRLFGSFDLVKRFTEGGYEIRIYHVAP